MTELAPQKRPPFVQIAAVPITGGWQLFALDDKGEVWAYDVERKGLSKIEVK
jgi:hypothetical protein